MIVGVAEAPEDKCSLVDDHRWFEASALECFCLFGGVGPVVCSNNKGSGDDVAVALLGGVVGQLDHSGFGGHLPDAHIVIEGVRVEHERVLVTDPPLLGVDLRVAGGGLFDVLDEVASGCEEVDDERSAHSTILLWTYPEPCLDMAAYWIR